MLCAANHIGFFAWAKKKGVFGAVDLVNDLHVAARASDALLVALFSLKLIEKVEDSPQWGQEKYSLSRASAEYLVPESRYYLGGLLEMEYKDYITPAALVECIKSGKPKAVGGDVFSSTDFESTKTFIMGMHSISSRPAEAFSRMFPFENYKCMLDIGGGSGVFPLFVLQKHPHMHAIMVDLENPCKIAEEIFRSNSISDRAHVKALNMFKDPLPNNFNDSIKVDVVFLSQILHDWPIEVGRNLLTKAYEVLPVGGVVVLHEKLLHDDRSGPVANAMGSIAMLFWVEGQQLTFTKLSEMLISVGFKTPQRIDTVGYWSVVYATK